MENYKLERRKRIMGEKMQQIWKKVLELDELPGLKESFFDLGGNSFMAAQVCQLYQEQTGIELEIAEFYEKETIEELIAQQ